MNDPEISVQFKMTYQNTEDTRTYQFDGLSAADLINVKQNILNINASLAAGTDGGLSSFFISDDGNFFKAITDAKSITIIEDVLDLSSSKEES